MMMPQAALVNTVPLSTLHGMRPSRCRRERIHAKQRRTAAAGGGDGWCRAAPHLLLFFLLATFIQMDRVGAVCNNTADKVLCEKQDPKLTEVPELTNPSTTVVDLGINAIAELSSGAFDALATLKILKLDRNNVKELPPGVFDKLIELDNLVLSHNAMTELPPKVFDALKKLRTLYLGGNAITVLPSGVFDELIELETLSLSSNMITELPSGVFDALINLKTLSLSSNMITELTIGVFGNLVKKLKKLKLNDNRIQLMPSNVFEKLTKLGSGANDFNIDGNVINCSGVTGNPSNRVISNPLDTCECDDTHSEFEADMTLSYEFPMIGCCVDDCPTTTTYTTTTHTSTTTSTSVTTLTTSTTATTTTTTTLEENALRVGTFVEIFAGTHDDKIGVVNALSSTGRSAKVTTCDGDSTAGFVQLKFIKKFSAATTETRQEKGSHVLFNYGKFKGKAGTVNTIDTSTFSGVTLITVVLLETGAETKKLPVQCTTAFTTTTTTTTYTKTTITITTTTKRVCRAGEYRKWASNTCRKCPRGTFRADEQHSYTSCAQHTPCNPREFVVGQPTATSNYKCRTSEQCADREYESKPPVKGEEERECTPVTPCVAGQYVGEAATATSDQVCVPCDGSAASFADGYDGGCTSSTTTTTTTSDTATTTTSTTTSISSSTTTATTTSLSSTTTTTTTSDTATTTTTTTTLISSSTTTATTTSLSSTTTTVSSTTTTQTATTTSTTTSISSSTTATPTTRGDQNLGNNSAGSAGNDGAPGASSPAGSILGAVLGVAALIAIGILIYRRTRARDLPRGARPGRNHASIVQNAAYEPPQPPGRPSLGAAGEEQSEDTDLAISALSHHAESAEYAAPSARQSELYDAGEVPGAADHSNTDAEYTPVGNDQTTYGGTSVEPAPYIYEEIDQPANGIDSEYYGVGGAGADQSYIIDSEYYNVGGAGADQSCI